MVPLMSPVLLLMVSPVGRAAALYVSGPPSLSVALIGNRTSSPTALLWLPGLTRRTCATVQVKLVLALAVPCVAVSVTVYGLPVCAPVAIVPLISPVVLLMLRPVGNPVAL